MPPKPIQLASSELRIRMYRVGFGDCFLISFPVDGEHHHMLMDCGVHAQGDIRTMDRVLANIESETKGVVAVVVATHAHQDHISGFARGREMFKRFSVGEVWMPWTENPDDASASRLRKKRLALVEALATHFSLRAGVSPAVLAVMANLSGNQTALQLLHSGMGSNARVRYLEAGDRIDNSAVIPGLAVKVLGPPRGQEFLSKMDPPAGQRYLRANGGSPKFANAVLPFDKKWSRTRNEAVLQRLKLSPADENAFKAAAADSSLEGLAFALDQVLNNTSVVTLLGFQGRSLLFPGDAQYGNWKWWLEQETAKEILSQIDFYKVGHHGSHNATPRGAVEQMTKGHVAAMVSTQNTPWKSIPQKKLIDALETVTAHSLVRSDSLVVSDAPRGPELGRLPKGFRKGELWFDYSFQI